MNLSRVILFIAGLLFTLPLFAQRIIYSEPETDDTRRLNFEVIGKVSGNFLIYKNLRSKNWIAVYDNDMKLIQSSEHNYIPDERLINVDFFPYAEHVYMIYQYQKKNVIYCNAVKVNGMGVKMSEIIELDTTHIGFAANNKIYSVVSSEDKSQLMLFKINSRNKSRYIFTTLLYDDNLNMKKRSSFMVPMEERNDYLREFSVDNEGDFVFAKFSRGNNDNIAKAEMVLKPAMADEYFTTKLNLDKIFLDEPHIKIDNGNKRYFLTSFYYKQRRGNIDGFYFYVFDKINKQPVLENSVVLEEDIRREARGEANVKMAFNDYFIRNVIVRKDGGFLIGSEAYYTTSRMNNWNRWNYLYPYSSFYDYQMYSPIYNSWYWRTRQGNSAVRHHADNVAILSFDKNGQLEWSNVIHKEQYDDESGDHISYLLLNTGGQLHFLFNQEEKRNKLLTDFSVDADGKLNRNPTLKNLDRGYDFLPKYGKQVSSRQMIIPCYYRNYICFAKVDYNS
ncbi:MAG TPA: hypothetical protein VGD33_03555 [Chitinophagaceae bacterium]